MHLVERLSQLENPLNQDEKALNKGSRESLMNYKGNQLVDKTASIYPKGMGLPIALQK